MALGYRLQTYAIFNTLIIQIFKFVVNLWFGNHTIQVISYFWVRSVHDMDRVPGKEMASGKTYVVSNEVRSVLDRQHDKWSTATAYDHVKCDLNVMTKLCKMLLHFFKDKGDEDTSMATCNKQTIGVFATLMEQAFKDDDFISGVYLLLNCRLES